MWSTFWPLWILSLIVLSVSSQATRMMIGAGNVLKKHAADHARRTAVTDEEAPEEDDLEICSRISFESAHSQCMENCGILTLAVVCQGRENNVKKLKVLKKVILCFQVVRPSHLLRTGYLKNALTEYLQIWNNRSLGVKDKLVILVVIGQKSRS